MIRYPIFNIRVNRNSLLVSVYSLLFTILFLSACATVPTKNNLQAENSMLSDIKETESKKGAGDKFNQDAARKGTPDFVPVSEELSPLKTRVISISGSEPLKNVMRLIAGAAGLNLIIEKGVDPNTMVTLTLTNVSAEDALKIIFSSVDYFYSIRENMLFVKAVETRMFEFGHPGITNNFSIDVGGDITGSASASGQGGGSQASTSAGLRGSVSQKVLKEPVNLWDSIEKTIASLISGGAPSSVAGQPSGSARTPSSFTINRMTGTIMVTASKKELEDVENYLAQIRRVLDRQVIIEARIVEVQLSEGLRYGIDWNALNIGKLGQLTFGTSGLANATPQGLEIGLTRWDINGLLRALQTIGDVNVLSNPRVNIMNGQTALLSVGRNVNFISKVTVTQVSTGTGTAPQYTPEQSSVLSGIMIGLAPYISDKGEVTMTVTPLASDLVKLDDKVFGTGTNAITISLPTVDLRELSTTVKVKDGDTIIIGGLIQNKETTTDNQVPGLGSIPLLGHLFKGRDKHSEKTELIIMLKPTVMLNQDNNRQ